MTTVSNGHAPAAAQHVQAAGQAPDESALAAAEAELRSLYASQLELRLLQRITQAANEASTLEQAVQTTLDEVCSHMQWPLGHAYMIAEHGTGELVPAAIWHLEDTARFEKFRELTEGLRYAPGVGLPGQVLSQAKLLWVSDLLADPKYPRAQMAKDLGLKAGLGCPVLAGRKVVAVLEFFIDRTMEPDSGLLDVMSTVGIQLGRVAERQRAQRELEESKMQLEMRLQELVALNHMFQEHLRAREEIEFQYRELQSYLRELHERMRTVTGELDRRCKQSTHELPAPLPPHLAGRPGGAGSRDTFGYD